MLVQRFLQHGLACLLGLGLMASATVHARTDDALTEDLMRKSGLWASLKEVGPQLQTQLEQNLAQARVRLPEQGLAHLRDAAAAAYAAEALRTKAKSLIGESASPGHAKALLAWYEGPLGTKITRYEEASATLDPATSAEQGQAQWARASAQRRKQLKQLVALTRSAELATRVAINTAVAVQVGAVTSPEAKASNQGQPVVSAEQIEAMRSALLRQAPEIEKAATDTLLASFALTYSHITDAELQRYLSFLGSTAGRHFTAITLAALDTTLTQAALDFGQRIARPSTAVARI